MVDKVLLITADRDSVAPLLSSMERAGYTPLVGGTNIKKLRHLLRESPDVIVLDWDSLDKAGEKVYKFISRKAVVIPLVVVLPSEGNPLRVEADAYIKPPLTWRKLSYRLKRLPSHKRFLEVKGLKLDLARRVLFKKGREYRLTPKLCRLLEVFMRNRGQVLTRGFLMKVVWDTDFLDDTRTLDVHIHWLRRVIEENPHSPVYLRTVRKVGYRFEVV